MFRLSYPTRPLLLLIIILILVACSPPVAPTSRPQTQRGGSIALWHFWDGEEEQVLNELLDRFATIYPNVNVLELSIPIADSSMPPDEQLFEQFLYYARQGLGPDIIIIPAQWERELIDSHLIQDLTPYETGGEIDTSIYLTQAREMLRSSDHRIYALPLSLHTNALYYNTTLTDTPPQTLQALLDHAAEGKKVALNTSFPDAIWGIQAFGGQLFDDQGRVVLDQGGFANWLGWLKKAQNEPNVIVSRDETVLSTLFKDGEVTYYVGTSHQLLSLQNALGKENVGVATLPAGPNDTSGPMLEADVMMFNAASSPSQTRLALQLATFLSNVEQQTRLAREIGRIPSTPVRSIQQIAPDVGNLVAQTRSAITIPTSYQPQLSDLVAHGDTLLVQVLEGVIEVQEAASQLTAYVNNRHSFERVADGSPSLPDCNVQGTVKLWHDWQDAEATALDRIRLNFMHQCPEAFITLIPRDSEEIPERYRAAIAEDTAPEMLLTSSTHIALLASEGLLQDISSMLDPAFLQQYIPAANEALSYEGMLYGLPITMHLVALYYNKALVSDPPLVMDDLLHQAQPEQQVVIPYGFYEAYWGIAAFGGTLFDDSYQLALNQGGFVEWLEWLETARMQPGVVVTDDLSEAKTLFQNGKAAYFVGPGTMLADLQQNPGAELVGVVPLPDGPEERARPILDVHGVALNTDMTNPQQEVAIAFARYLGNTDNQRLLMEEATAIPANVNVDIADNSAIAGFIEQAQNVSVLPHVPQLEPVIEWGDTVYQNVLENNINATEAVSGFIQLVTQANGARISTDRTPTLAPTPEPAPACQGEGEVMLWHSWSDAKAAALNDIVLAFAEHCPAIQVTTSFVPADELRRSLAQAIQNDTMPDVLIASHTLIKPLDGLIKDGMPLIEQANLVQYLPISLAPLQRDGVLAGVPITLDVVALYYNTSLVNTPATTLDELLNAATAERVVALDTSFYAAFWGIAATGGPVLDEEGNLVLNQDNFVPWLRWLDDARQQPGVILSTSKEDLRSLFASGQAAYMVANAEALPALQTALGRPAVGVELLPAGPEGEARPLVHVEAFLFPQAVSDEQTQLAINLVQFATAPERQQILLRRTGTLPTNNLAISSLNRDSAIHPFITQATQTGIPVPDALTMDAIQSAGSMAYSQVLTNGVPPAEAVDAFIETIQAHTDPHPLP